MDEADVVRLIVSVLRISKFRMLTFSVFVVDVVNNLHATFIPPGYVGAEVACSPNSKLPDTTSVFVSVFSLWSVVA